MCDADMLSDMSNRTEWLPSDASASKVVILERKCHDCRHLRRDNNNVFFDSATPFANSQSYESLGSPSAATWPQQQNGQQFDSYGEDLLGQEQQYSMQGLDGLLQIERSQDLQQQQMQQQHLTATPPPQQCNNNIPQQQELLQLPTTPTLETSQTFENLSYAATDNQVFSHHQQHQHYDNQGNIAINIQPGEPFSIPLDATAVSPSSSSTSTESIANNNNNNSFNLPSSVVSSVETDALLSDLEQGSSSTKASEVKLVCQICGDVAINHVHYGGHCCFSCKAFFRRAVNWQATKGRSFDCKGDRNCDINIKTRKACQYCRFQKCIKHGLNPSWVLTEDERRQRFKKFHRIATSQPSPGSQSDNMMLDGVVGAVGPGNAPPNAVTAASTSSSTTAAAKKDRSAKKKKGKKARRMGGAQSSQSSHQSASSFQSPALVNTLSAEQQHVEAARASVLQEVFGEEIATSSPGTSLSNPEANQHQMQPNEEQEVVFIAEAFQRAMAAGDRQVQEFLATCELTQQVHLLYETEVTPRLMLFLSEMASFNLLDRTEQETLLRTNLSQACHLAAIVLGHQVDTRNRSLQVALRLVREMCLQQVCLVLLLLVVVFSRTSKNKWSNTDGGPWSFEGHLWVDQCQVYYFRLLQKHLYTCYPAKKNSRRGRNAGMSWQVKTMAKLVRVLSLLQEA